jgi:hypothetical protein
MCKHNSWKAKLFIQVLMEQSLTYISSFPPSTSLNIANDTCVDKCPTVTLLLVQMVATNKALIHVFNEILNMWSQEFPCFFKNLGNLFLV